MKKVVNIYASVPIRGVLSVPIFGTFKKVKLTTDEIVKIIRAKGRVEEVLPNGKTIPLDFNNYNAVYSEQPEEKVVVPQAPAVEEVVEETPVVEEVAEEPAVEEVPVTESTKAEVRNNKGKGNK